MPVGVTGNDIEDRRTGDGRFTEGQELLLLEDKACGREARDDTAWCALRCRRGLWWVSGEWCSVRGETTARARYCPHFHSHGLETCSALHRHSPASSVSATFLASVYQFSAITPPPPDSCGINFFRKVDITCILQQQPCDHTAKMDISVEKHKQ